MSNWGFKIAETGNDVKTCTEDKLIFTSKYPALKLHSSGSGSKTFTNNEGFETLTTHNLGYRPFFAVWVDEGDGNGFQLCTFTGSAASGNYFVGYMGTSTTTTLELVAITTYVGGFWGDPTAPANKTVDYAWAIFYDPIEDE